MRFSSLSAGLLAGIALAAPAPEPQTLDTTPFEAFSFKTIPFTPDKAAKGAAAGFSPFSAASQNAVNAGRCPTRIEWRRLSNADRTAFVNSIKCLMERPSKGGRPGATNRWEDLVWVHQQMTPTVHMSPAFLPWHRYYVAIFENLIRSECGYRGPMTWWDETLDAGRFRSSLIFQDAYFSRAAAKGQSPNCVTTGTFANKLAHIGPGTGRSTHCLARSVDETLTAQCNQGFVNYCNSFTTYRDMEPCAEQGPHAYGHNGIGALMSDVYASPSDPVFFMHHGFVDRNWYRWQNANPGARMYQLSGSLTLNSVLTSRGLVGDVRVRDMMDTRGGFLCYEYDY